MRVTPDYLALAERLENIGHLDYCPMSHFPENRPPDAICSCVFPVFVDAASALRIADKTIGELHRTYNAEYVRDTEALWKRITEATALNDRLREALGKLVDVASDRLHGDEKNRCSCAACLPLEQAIERITSLLSEKGEAGEAPNPCNEHVEGCIAAGFHRTHVFAPTEPSSSTAAQQEGE